MQYVGTGDAEDVNDICGEIGCEEEFLRGVEERLVDIGLKRIFCIWIRVSEGEEGFLKDVHGCRARYVGNTDC